MRLFGGSAVVYLDRFDSRPTGNAIAPAWYMVAISAIALVAIDDLPHEHSGKDLSEIE